MSKKNIHVATYQRVIYNNISVKEHLEKDLPDFGTSVVIRLGGTMPYEKYDIHINNMVAVKNSINKEKQKQLLQKGGIPVMPFIKEEDRTFPLVVKAKVRSGGKQVFYCKNEKDFKAAVEKIKGGYYIEEFFNTTSEYRLHCTRDKVFFAVKKVKRNANDIIITRDNHFNTREFLKPRLWKEIQETCVKAMTALDLDIACFDVMYDSSNNNKHRFAIAEANTNPELLNNTYAAYLEALKEIIFNKIKNKRVAKPREELKPVGRVNDAPPAVNRRQKLNKEEKLDIIEKITKGEYKIVNNQVVIEL